MLTGPSVVALFSGLGLGLGLIVAIGAQNAFVLRQGLLLSHVGAVVAVCTLSDLVLIAAGVLGAGTAVTRLPALVRAASLVGAAFLLAYAWAAARRATRPGVLVGGGTPAPADEATGSGAAATLGTCLALTWLNPHVYLDTVVLLGSTASTFGDRRWAFALGAWLGSIVWFAGLGFGARLLRPVFGRPAAWRVLDAGIAAVMAVLALSLVLRGVRG